MDCSSPTLEFGLPCETGNPLRNMFQEREQLYDVLAGDEPLRNALGRHLEGRCIVAVIFGEADAIHILQKRRKECAVLEEEVPMSYWCATHQWRAGHSLTNVVPDLRRAF